jgi:Na+-transporting methylmalonyl-CoA/oxaloacetate decarboxylase gamma subunit
MTPNFLILGAAALVPLFLGAIWYNPKVLGNAWMKAADISEEKIQNANMVLIMGITLVFSVLLSLAIYMMVIHQTHVYSIVMGEPALEDSSSPLSVWLAEFMEKYGQNYRTFKHGAFHGFFGGITVATPVLTINALFERKGAKYIAINSAY